MPSASFPKAAVGDAELEATYRFFGNDRVTPEQILAPHVRQTARRCSEAKRFVVAHDTTEFNYGKSSREDLGRVGRGKSFGFYGHFALAVDRGDVRAPLGVLGLVVHQRRGGKGRRGHRTLQADPKNEGRRWFKLVQRVEEALPTGTVPIHVMDREADSYALMADIARGGGRFVIRMAQMLRKVVDRPEDTVGEVLSGATVIAERDVPLSARGERNLPYQKKAYPPRNARIATLHVSAERVTLKRPISSSETPERTLTVNVVHVFEPAPSANEPAVDWRLWTTESIATEQDVLAVVDDYRARWRIEEFFKALKSGCALESRQLESHRGLVKALCLFAAVAWRLLLLRTLAREDGRRSAAFVLSKTQLYCLRGALKQLRKPPLPDDPTVREALLGVASLGGHIKNNGDPGWIVLGRGFDDLLKIELGYMIATAKM